MATTQKKMGRDSGKSATPTTSCDDTALVLHQPTNGEPRVDSRVLAQRLGIQHQNIRELLSNYADDFRQLGILRFETGEILGRDQPEKYMLLSEDQTYLLLTYSRNTAKVRALKVRLVQAFREARQAQDLTRTEYLPTYHQLHDEIAALAAGSVHERFVHMNVNKAINRAVGIGSGERGEMDMPGKAALILAQYVANTAMRGASDHRDGYQRAKTAMEGFGAVLLEVAHG